MNYFNYAIKCVIRNIIYKFMNPKIFIPLLVGVIATFLLVKFTPVFGWEGDNDYTDKNNTIKLQYDSINQDLLNRIQNFSGNSDNIDNLIDTLKNNNYNYYCFYGSANGSSMVSSSYYATNDLYIYFYDRENFSSSATVYELYQGMTTNIRLITSGLGSAYVFTGNNVSTWEIESFYIPTVLINYKSPVVYSYINNKGDTNSIVGAINQQTNSINQQTTVIQDTQAFLEDSTVTDNSMAISTSSMTTSDGGVNSFFTNFMSNIYSIFNNIDSDVETITIPLLPTGNSITLRSDAISSHIINTPIYVLIQTFWWFVIGRSIIGFVYRMIKWLSDGEIAERGIFAFVDWLDNYNVIIKSYMM